MAPSGEPVLKPTVHYGYFVLQARASRGPDGIELTGVLENLGTGEKQPFEGRDGLARMIEEWGRQSGVLGSRQDSEGQATTDQHIGEADVNP